MLNQNAPARLTNAGLAGVLLLAASSQAQPGPIAGPALLSDLNQAALRRQISVIAPTSVGVLMHAPTAAGDLWVSDDPESGLRCAGLYGIGLGSYGRPLVADLGGRVVHAATYQVPRIGILPMVCATDGIATTPLALFSPGAISAVFAAKGLAFFNTTTGLLATDGTPEGTFEPASISGYWDGVEYRDMIVLAGLQVAAFDDSFSAMTPISNAPADWIVVVNDRLVWFSPQSKQLFASDGSAGSAVALSPALGVAAFGSRRAVVNGDKAIFTTDAETWITDGTPQGTTQLLDFPLDAEAVAGAWYGIDASKTGLNTLYRVEGTPGQAVALASTRQVRSAPSPVGGNQIDERFVPFGGRVYFRGYIAESGDELWSTDGTPGGTSLVADLTPGSAGTQLQTIGRCTQGVLVSTGLLANDEQLFLADGPVSIRAIRPPGFAGATVSSLSGAIGPHGEGALFAGRDPDGPILQVVGERPGQVAPFANILTPLSPSSRPSLVHRAQPLIQAPGDAIVFLSTPEFGAEPWRYRADARSLELVADLTPGSPSTTPFSSVATDAGVFFTVRLAASDRLYFTDGTALGTRQVAEHPRTGTQAIFDLSAAGPRCFFRSAGSGTIVRQWLSDGTPAGTTAFTSLNSSQAENRAATLGSRIYFQAVPSPSGGYLYSSAINGTDVQLQAISGAALPPDPSGLVASADRVFFNASVGSGDVRPFCIDGAGQTSGPLADVFVSAIGFAPCASGVLFNATKPGTLVEALWFSDGTPGGTRQVLTPDGRALTKGYQVAMTPVGPIWQAAVAGEDQTLWRIDEQEALAVAIPRADDPGRPLTLWNTKSLYLSDGWRVRNRSRLFLTLDDNFTGREPFMIDLCPADINNDSLADLDDFMEFLAAWDQSGARADRNLDGGADLLDFFLFFESFDAGCPA